MGLHLKVTNPAGLGAPGLAAETAIYNTPVLPPVGSAISPAGTPVNISGTYWVTAGTGATAVTLRLRQGLGVGGPIVQTLPAVTVVAGSTYPMSFGFTDATGFLQAGGQYTLTAQQTGGTANGSSAGLDFEVLV